MRDRANGFTSNPSSAVKKRTEKGHRVVERKRWKGKGKEKVSGTIVRDPAAVGGNGKGVRNHFEGSRSRG